METSEKQAPATGGLRQMPPTPATRTNLDIINDCDNFPYPDTDPEAYTSHISTYYFLFMPPCTQPLGYLLPSVALTLHGIAGWTIDEENRTITLDLPDLNPSQTKSSSVTSTLFNFFAGSQEPEAEPPEYIEPTPEAYQKARTEVLTRTTHAMRSTDHFAVLRKWRNEPYPVFYRDPITRRKTLLATMERSASPLFGIVTYGAHLTAYKKEGEDGEIKIWVARRAKSKQTYPNLLDQTVAGGISSNETALESVIREAQEEAALPPDLVKRKVKAVGTVTYTHIRDERAGGETRLVQPECQMCYELDLTGEEVVPRVGDDGEVGSMELMSVKEIQESLARGEWKPNCAVVMMDFFVRHGIVTRENETDYCEIVERLHRRLEFPVL